MVIHSNGAYTSGSLLGDQWKQVQDWPKANREAESDASYETEEEEEIYVTLDLGPNVDRSVIASALDYQLIGLDTPTPYLKVGNRIFRGTPGALIGDELILKDVRDPINPIRHSHNPIGTTQSLRISFEEVHLIPKNDQSTTTGDPTTEGASTSNPALKPKAKLGRRPLPKTIPNYLSSSQQASTSIMAREDAARVIPSDGKLRDNRGKLYSMKSAKKATGGRKKKKVEGDGEEEEGEEEESGNDDEGDDEHGGASASNTEQQEDVVMKGTESNADVEGISSPTTDQSKRRGRPPGSKTVNRKVPLDSPSLLVDPASDPTPTRKKRAPPTKKVQPSLFSAVPASGPSNSTPNAGTSTGPTQTETQLPQSMVPLHVDVEAMMQGDRPDEDLLAEFLGVDIPEGPPALAPHLTDRDWIEGEIERLRREPAS